ncbi:glutaredoxin family protein [Ureibacillus sp. 179-F W5.1 NHS]|uniref:Glutaredoxin family protein n=1 Tax=Lysinibacillus halotolerans TaxID=1368476 RepID=A0A3M8H7X8_9BACI|nr:glutaredoxin domain-containing protein [Lysinibacillus halotolerans]RNC98497.1 glutaredoxin family protein [Lysinibacillus halotolerans]
MKIDVTLYTTTLCPVCGMVKDFLKDMNIIYKEINVDINPIEMIKLIGKTRRLSVPQTNINGEWIFGFDPVRILEVLNAKSN